MRMLIALLLSWITILNGVEKKDFITLPQEQVYEGDYFNAGGSIQISGVVKGDVYVFGSQIYIDGVVEGDVIASGGTVEIGGEVRGNVRLAAGQIELNGKVGLNVTAMGGNIQSKGSIGGNAVFTGGIVDLSGSIGGNVTLTASNARLLGDIDGNIKAYVGQLHIDSQADLKGDLEYSSGKKAIIDPNARIEGKITYHPTAIEFFEGKWRHGFIFKAKITAILMNLFFSFVIGWIVIKMFPRKLKTTLNTIKNRPIKSLGVGILVLIFLPLACLILFITVLGFPLALALLAFSLLTFYSAKIFPIIWIANFIFSKIGLKPNTLFVLFLGLILFFLVIQIPFIGPILSFIATLEGLGAIVLGRAHHPKKS